MLKLPTHITKKTVMMLPVLAAASTLILSGCSSSTSSTPAETASPVSTSTPMGPQTTPTAEANETKWATLTEGKTVVDVRTPEEYADGHAPNATLIDVSSPDFDSKIAELNPDDTYVVYCRSGNRSALAAEKMEAAGLTVIDAGGLPDIQNLGAVLVVE